MTELPDESDPRVTAWRRFCRAMDDFGQGPRVDHGLPTDPDRLGALIAEQPDFAVGAPELFDRLVEQEGHLAAWDAWGPAYEWSHDPRRGTS